MYTLSTSFRVKEVTSIVVKGGVPVEFVKIHRVTYQFITDCLGQHKAVGDKQPLTCAIL